MELHVVTVDQVVSIDGEVLNFAFQMPDNEWAVHWFGESGEVEFADERLNEIIESPDKYLFLVDLFVAEKARLEAEAEAARIAWEEEQNRLAAEAEVQNATTEEPASA